MADFKTPVERTAVALLSKRDVKLTMPWLSEQSRHEPRAGNVVHPLINGERAFAAVHEAIAGAKKSIDIISWGFDPSMRLIRPNGARLGELLKTKAAQGCEVRVLIWKNALANFVENNIIGDGLGTSGGGSAGFGSGVGSTRAGGGGSGAGATSGPKDGFNNYAGKLSGGTSGAVQHGDPQARASNRAWFAKNSPGLSFRTRDFDMFDRTKIGMLSAAKRGIGDTVQHMLFTHFPSHHQKMILIDYESPEHAVGFVMGHNLLRNYWDTDAHEYASEARDGFAPWQDLSTRVYGAVLWDLNDNFCTAWREAQPWLGSDLPIAESRARIQPSAFEASAHRHGAPEMAQICRTQPQERDQSILESYKLALSNARNYIYFENQYFRSTELAMHMRTVRRNLKGAGWKRDLYVFVVTNVPEDSGRTNTYEMLQALGKGAAMPHIDKKTQADQPESADNQALRRRDLEGVNIHVCTLCASGLEYEAPQAQGTGGVNPPKLAITPCTSSEDAA